MSQNQSTPVYQAMGKEIPFILEAIFNTYEDYVSKRTDAHQGRLKEDEVTIYYGLEAKQYRSGTFLIAKKRTIYSHADVAPIGSIIKYVYRRGSNKHDYYYFRKYFLVVPGKYKVSLDIKGQNVEVEVENLMPLPEPTEKDIAEARAEIRNRGWKPSEYDPVERLYWYWMMRPEVKEVEKTEEEEKEGEIRLEIDERPVELTVELTPKIEEVSIEEAAPQPQKAVSEPRKTELVRIYLLSMRLPSRYLVQKVSRDRVSKLMIERREMNHEIARHLDAIRIYAYRHIQRIFAYVEEYGTWIAVTEEAVAEADRVSREVINRLKEIASHINMTPADIEKRYSVKAIPIYLEPDHARELLHAAIKSLSEDVEELENKIEEAKKAKRATLAFNLTRDQKVKKALLEAFKKYLSQLE